MQSRRYLIVLVTLIACLMAGTALAQGIKERIKARQPAVMALLSEGVVGENNQGYLEFRGAAKQADVVNAENADRKMVYAAIAKKTGTTPDVVGQRRAAQLVQIVPAGSWVQNPGGQWYQK